MNSFSLFNYDTVDEYFDLDQKIYAVLLFTKSLTVNRWLVDEFPNDYQLNANEEFMDFLDNPDCDISEFSSLSLAESEQFKKCKYSRSIFN